MAKLKLRVSKKDIDNGQAWDGQFCPIARAFDRVLGDGIVPDVGNRIVNFNSGADYDLPLPSLKLNKTAQQFIEDFDNNEKVKPFSFIIRIKNSVAKLLKIRKRYLVAA